MIIDLISRHENVSLPLLTASVECESTIQYICKLTQKHLICFVERNEQMFFFAAVHK